MRSVTVHGDREAAEQARDRWAEAAVLVRCRRQVWSGVTLAELLGVWLAAEHDWKPSTLVGYRSAAGFLARDPVGGHRAVDVGPQVLRAACARWRQDGSRDPTVWGRVRCLRSALRWAYAERILERDPLDGVPGPPQPGVRLHAPVAAVRDLIAHAHHDVTAAGAGGGLVAVHRAEQVLLLVRLAADAGARRGELAALQVDDLDGDVLTIARAASAEVVGPTKTRQVRRLTLGATTAGLWRDSVATWRERTGGAAAFGPWLFSRDADHGTRLRASTLGHWFATLAADSGHRDVTLHRLRHTVATTLVERGDLLQAQHRLGHRDASTTLRIYSHATPLTDADAADALDQLYRTAGS